MAVDNATVDNDCGAAVCGGTGSGCVVGSIDDVICNFEVDCWFEFGFTD